jgi:hypothetical protein
MIAWVRIFEPCDCAHHLNLHFTLDIAFSGQLFGWGEARDGLEIARPSLRVDGTAVFTSCPLFVEQPSFLSGFV